MKEGYTGRPETQQEKTNVIDFEAVRQKRQTREKPHTSRKQTPPTPRGDKTDEEDYQSYSYFGGKKIRTWATREELDQRNAKRGKPPISDELWEQLKAHAREQNAKTEAWKRERDEARAKAGFFPQPDPFWELYERYIANDFKLPPEDMEKLEKMFQKHAEQNEENAKRREKERLEKEKARQDMLKAYNRYHEERAKMTPEEKEAGVCA
jgi:hypothetical protein